MAYGRDGRRGKCAAARGVGAALALLLLSGCAGMMGNDSAYRYMREQQEKQAYLDEQEIKGWEKRKPADEDMAVQMLVETQRQGRYFASLAYADAIQQQFGNTPQVMALRAEALRKTGQLETAAAVFQSLTHTAQAAQAWHGLGLIEGERGDYAKAVHYLQQAADLQPTGADLQNDLGYAQLRLGQVGSARLSLGKAVELEPANPRILSNMALFLWLNGQGQDAEAFMQQAQISVQAQAQIRALAHEIQRELTAAVRRPQAPAVVSRVGSPGGLASGVELAKAGTGARHATARGEDEGRNLRLLDMLGQDTSRRAP